MVYFLNILMPVLRQKLSAALQIWSLLTPQSIFSKNTTQETETTCRHTLESHAKNLQSVQAMEKSMDISIRWIPESAEWVAAAEKVKKLDIPALYRYIGRSCGIPDVRINENEHVPNR